MSEIQTYPKVSIIILHFKNIRCLLDCIASLNKISYENFDIFIVHNGPKSKVLEENLAPISQHITEVIDTGKNVGFARGNNIGIKQALRKRAEYILLLNDDTVVSADFLDILVDAGENNPDAGMLGSKIYYFGASQKIWFSGGRLDERAGLMSFPHADEMDGCGKDVEPEETDYLTGCALLVKRVVIEKIGLLDERFFLYWEDSDWGLRSKKSGFRNLVVPASKIWHKVSASSGGNDSPLKAYHKTRGHLLFSRLHAPGTFIKLIYGFLRNIAWLLFKASGPERGEKALAYLTALMDYFIGKTGPGPEWLWRKGV